jgi:hypothetical protein
VDPDGDQELPGGIAGACTGQHLRFPGMSVRYTDFWEQMASAAVVQWDGATIRVANQSPCRVLGAMWCTVVEMRLDICIGDDG